MTQSKHDVLIKVLQIPCTMIYVLNVEWFCDGGDGFRFAVDYGVFFFFLACCLSVWFMRIWFFTGALCTHPHATCRDLWDEKKPHFACTQWSSLAFHLPCNNIIYLDSSFFSLRFFIISCVCYWYPACFHVIDNSLCFLCESCYFCWCSYLVYFAFRTQWMCVCVFSLVWPL